MQRLWLTSMKRLRLSSVKVLKDVGEGVDDVDVPTVAVVIAVVIVEDEDEVGLVQMEAGNAVDETDHIPDVAEEEVAILLLLLLLIITVIIINRSNGQRLRKKRCRDKPD